MLTLKIIKYIFLSLGKMSWCKWLLSTFKHLICTLHLTCCVSNCSSQYKWSPAELIFSWPWSKHSWYSVIQKITIHTIKFKSCISLYLMAKTLLLNKGKIFFSFMVWIRDIWINKFHYIKILMIAFKLQWKILLPFGSLVIAYFLQWTLDGSNLLPTVFVNRLKTRT